MSAGITASDARDLLSALRSGTVPDRGLEQIAVGIEPLLGDCIEQLRYVELGRSDVRFLIGPYGAGKSFATTLLAQRAMQAGFAVSSCVVSADAPIGDTAMLYRRVAEGLRTSGRQTGCALADVVERWLVTLRDRCAHLDGVNVRDVRAQTAIAQQVETQIDAALADLGDSDVGLARALAAYYRARTTRDATSARDALHWIRGSNRVPVEARRKLGIKGEVTRETAFGLFKGLFSLVRHAGFKGTLVVLDEAETILRLPLAAQRAAAFETLRLIVDACGENQLPGALFVVTGTEQFLTDEHAGVRSYAALAQRLERPVAAGSPTNRRSPVLHLEGLDTARLTTAAIKVRDTHSLAYSYDATSRLSDELLGRLATQAATAFGEETPRVPRRFLREVVYLCDLCEEHPTFDASLYVLGTATAENAGGSLAR